MSIDWNWLLRVVLDQSAIRFYSSQQVLCWLHSLNAAAYTTSDAPDKSLRAWLANVGKYHIFWYGWHQLRPASEKHWRFRRLYHSQMRQLKNLQSAPQGLSEFQFIYEWKLSLDTWNIVKQWNIVKHSETSGNILKHRETSWNAVKHCNSIWYEQIICKWMRGAGPQLVQFA